MRNTQREPQRRRARAAIAAAAAMAAIGAATAAPAAADDCANAAFRTGAAANMAHCRAYEQVSPVDKNGYDVGTFFGYMLRTQAARDGSGLLFHATGAFGDASSSLGLWQPYLSRRSGAGWSTTGLNVTGLGGTQLSYPLIYWVSDDLGAMQADLMDYRTGATADPGGIWLRDDSAGQFTRLTQDGQGQTGVAISGDGRRLLLGAHPLAGGPPLRLLTREADGSIDLQPVGLGADGNPLADTGGVPRTLRDTISPDGCRVVFESGYHPFGFGASVVEIGPEAQPQLQVYLRDVCGAAPETVHVSAPAAGAPADSTAPRQATYWAGSRGLERLFFTSGERLTADSTADRTISGTGDSFGDLYAYDVEEGSLRDITVDGGHPDGARVQGVLGASEDGRVVYFVARGKVGTDEGVEGQPNLYRWEDGAGNGSVSFVATLADDFDLTDPSQAPPVGDVPNRDASNFYILGNLRTSRVAADGSGAMFTSSRELTGQDTGGVRQIFYHDAAAPPGEGLRCASCGSGPVPPARADLMTQYTNTSAFQHVRRNLSADGARLFFETETALVPQDANGRRDVYEYDTQAHEVTLISGAGSSAATFVDADADGDDVFFVTRQQLVGQDSDAVLDVYTARVGGGLAGQSAITSGAGCVEDACQGAPSTPLAAPPLASLTFAGAGNATRPSAARRATVSRPRTVRGSRGTLAVKVPARGTIRVSGAGLRPVVRKARRAATYRVRIALTKRSARRLARDGRLSVPVRVRFQPAGRAAQTLRLTLRFAAPARAGRHQVKTTGSER